MTKSIPALVATIALVIIAAAIMFERAATDTWLSRLIFPPYQEAISRHTPLHSEGTFLPLRFTENTTLTAAENPFILAVRTEVPSNITLTMEPGITVFASEFAELAVFGSLHVQGTQADPVILTSNERHPQNQIWNGIILEDSSQAQIDHARIHYASPGLTCLGESRAAVKDSEITQTLIGVFTQSPSCATTNTRIEAKNQDYVRPF